MSQYRKFHAPLAWWNAFGAMSPRRGEVGRDQSHNVVTFLASWPVTNASGMRGMAQLLLWRAVISS